jgi:hypothetical protein
MDYLYFLANASLTLRVVEYLHSMPQLPVQFMTVIHQIDGWVIKVKLNRPLTPHQHGDFRAFMNELGIPYDPEIRLQMALWSLYPSSVTLRKHLPFLNEESLCI